MNRKEYYLVFAVTLIVAFVFTNSFAAEEYSSTAAIFEIIPDARTQGMAGAFIGLADDENATLFNPAGLGLQGGGSLITSYSDQYQKMSYNSLLVGIGPLGLAGMRLSSEPIEITNQYGISTGQNVSYSSTGLAGGIGLSNRTFGLSFGRNDISLGIGALAYHSDLYSITGAGYSFSFGGLYRRFIGRWSYFQLGVLVPGSSLVETSDFDFPLGTVKFRDASGTVVQREDFSGPLGAGVALKLRGGESSVTRVALDWRKKGGLRGGLEQKFWLLTGRIGFKSSGALTAGAGLDLSGSALMGELKLDGAYEWRAVLGGSWMLSFALGF